MGFTVKGIISNDNNCFFKIIKHAGLLDRYIYIYRPIDESSKLIRLIFSLHTDSNIVIVISRIIRTVP